MNNQVSYTTKSRVAFKIEDAICPEQETIFANLTGEVQVVGKIHFLSDGGTREGEFAVVKVPGLSKLVIVPREKIEELSDKQKGTERRLAPI